MPDPVSDTPSVPHSSAVPNVSAQGYLVTDSGFLPDHSIALRITHAVADT
ncbi:MAG: hypothetical protein J2P17_07055 [Mycobacterium sp.]|nr:hypothetical protein [Mycobacterium sp.]